MGNVLEKAPLSVRDAYESPAVELVLTEGEIVREVFYAGAGTQIMR